MDYGSNDRYGEDILQGAGDGEMVEVFFGHVAYTVSGPLLVI